MVEKPTDADWILKAMIAVAAADRRLDAREVGLIQKVYRDQTGRSVDVSGIVLAVQAYATKRDVVAEFSAAGGSMSRETREENPGRFAIPASLLPTARSMAAERPMKNYGGVISPEGKWPGVVASHRRA